MNAAMSAGTFILLQGIVLKLYPVLQRAKIMANVQPPRRAHTAEDSLAFIRKIFSERLIHVA